MDDRLELLPLGVVAEDRVGDGLAIGPPIAIEHALTEGLDEFLDDIGVFEHGPGPGVRVADDETQFSQDGSHGALAAAHAAGKAEDKKAACHGEYLTGWREWG